MSLMHGTPVSLSSPKVIGLEKISDVDKVPIVYGALGFVGGGIIQNSKICCVFFWSGLHCYDRQPYTVSLF